MSRMEMTVAHQIYKVNKDIDPLIAWFTRYIK